MIVIDEGVRFQGGVNRVGGDEVVYVGCLVLVKKIGHGEGDQADDDSDPDKK